MRNDPLRVFYYKRVAWGFALCFLITMVALVIGMVGYHFFESMS